MKPGQSRELISHSADETILMGLQFAESLKPGDIVGLYGDLGSGKTEFVKGICRYFEVKDKVCSPTFILVNEYLGRDLKINHFDLYRLKSVSEFKEIGLDNYINNNSICLIEWAELADEYLNESIKRVYFKHGKKETERLISYYI